MTLCYYEGHRVVMDLLFVVLFPVAVMDIVKVISRVYGGVKD